MEEQTVEGLLRAAAELVRAESLPAFEAAWRWAAPQARTEEELRLLVATLVVLHGVQALVVPRRLDPSALASLHVTGTRSAPGGAVRRHLFVSVTPDGASPSNAEPDALCFSAAEVRTVPFRCAARILGELLTRLSHG